jgi:hypothetical protein
LLYFKEKYNLSPKGKNTFFIRLAYKSQFLCKFATEELKIKQNSEQ